MDREVSIKFYKSSGSGVQSITPAPDWIRLGGGLVFIRNVAVSMCARYMETNRLTYSRLHQLD